MSAAHKVDVASSKMQYADLYEMILIERNIEDMSVWARVVVLPCAMIASAFVLAAWSGVFSGSVASTIPGSIGAILLFASLYLPRLAMLALQVILSKVDKRPPRWLLTMMWTVIGISLWLSLMLAVWSTNYPGLLLPLVYGLSPGQSLESFSEETRHDDGLVLAVLKIPMGNRLTILCIFGVFSACLPHLLIGSLSLPPAMSIVITLLFLAYCCLCVIFAVRHTVPDLIPFCPHIIYMFLVAVFVHLRHLVANIQPTQWSLSPLYCYGIPSLCRFLSEPLHRFFLRISVALFSCCVCWALGSKGVRFFVDAVFIIGYSTIIFRYVIKTQGFLIPPNLSSLSVSVPSRTGGYSLKRPLLPNVLLLLSSIAISLPVQFLPLDWLPFGYSIVAAIGDDVPPNPGLMLNAFVVWSVLGPMLLLRDLRLSIATLVFVYGGNLVYVVLSVFCSLRAIANSSPSPPFVLKDVVLEVISVSVCLLLLLTVSHVTMQVKFFSLF